MKDAGQMRSMVDWAQQYAARGWHVFPVPPGTKKSHKSAAHSDGRPWGATTDPDEIARDWARWPEANIGIVCGPTSGLFVVEADTLSAHGTDGVGNLTELIEKNGGLPHTIEAESPSGSWHIYFKWPEGEKISNSVGIVAPAVDVRGEGGMVVATPSGKGDACLHLANPPVLFDLADCPEWLLARCRKPKPRSTFNFDAGGPDYGDDERNLAEVEEALSYIDPDAGGYQRWLDILMALHDEFGEAGLPAAERWSSRGAKYVVGEVEEKWRGFKPGGGIGIGTVFSRAQEGGCDLGALRRKHRGGGADAGTSGNGAGAGTGAEEGPKVEGDLRISDFIAYMPTHGYIFIPTREMWAAASVNARIKDPAKGLTAAAWLDRNRPVEQMTWAPGEPLEIKNRLMAEGGWVAYPGATVFNLYRPPELVRRAGQVTMWTEHLIRVFGPDAEHIIRWLAHRVQRPHEKINHALVLGGDQGIGKDTILEPVKRAIGPWNFMEASPQQVLGRFNGFLKSVVLRISEARDLGEADRFAFYDHMKTYTAAPPDVLRVDEKHRPEYAIPNVCGVIITTNHKADGIHLPADDRRHFVAWSGATKEDFPECYWQRLYGWYEAGGNAAVAHHLATLDLSAFNPKAPPPKTAAFYEIVNAARAPETAEIADALDRLGRPGATTLQLVAGLAVSGFSEWLTDRRNARQVPHRMEECGYTPVRNEAAKDGLWKVNDRRQVIYAKREMNNRDRIAAASALVGASR